MCAHKLSILVLFTAGMLARQAAAQSQIVVATVDAGKAGEPISPYLYGQFIEHIGGIITNGFWAEMLDDRKFYYPIESAAAAEAGRGGRGGPGMRGGGFGRGAMRRWTAIGSTESIVMDANRPYVGEQSPLVKLPATAGPKAVPGNASESCGIRQSGLTIGKNKSYVGHVVLAGDAGVQVAVSLVWGTGENERESVAVGKLSPAYAKFPLNFKTQADSTDARLEIAGTGSGSFHVGAVSLMPADNLEGFRPEVIAALKQLRSGVYRFPGGNFVSAHDWRDAIGDPDRRPPIMDPVWNAVQSNDVGTDEFMTMCRLLEVEPYITVNAGFGEARSAAQYVEYCNASAEAPMGRLRAENGHPQPYKVKFWGIGNEMWGDWQFGAVSLAQFEVKHNLFAKAMRKVDPTIVLIASGAMPDAMTGSKQSLRLTGKLIPDYLSPGDWTGGLFLHCLDNMDMVSEHFYSYNNQRFDLAKADRVRTDANEPLVDWMRRPANHVRSKVEAYQDYLERIPALKNKRVPICMDEWAYSGVPANSYKVVPAYAWVFHEMFRHTDLYRMAGFTFATSLLSSSRTEAVLNPAGLLFKLYRDHFGTIPVEVAGNSPQPKPKYPPGGEEPRIDAGSDTFPLDVTAAWTSDRKALTVAVINPTESPRQLSLSIRGAALAGTGRLWRMAPADINATIVVGQKPGVEVEEQPVEAVPTTPTFAPFSVTIYEFPAQ